jgi:DNA-binding NarL/FixJ family response regulator
MRILLAEPQALTREGLKRVVLELDAASEFVEAVDATAARASLRSGLPLDAALFDDAFFTPDEISAMRHGRPAMLLIALTTHDAAIADVQWLAAGANALVPKSAPTAILNATLRLAIAGNVCVQYGGTARTPVATSNRAANTRRGTGPLNLTPRQQDVLERIAQGCPNKIIADELGIGVRTVKGHVSVILRALHADNRADAGRSARRWLARTAAGR